jgi:membrane protein
VRIVLTLALLVLIALVALGVVLTGPIARELGEVFGVGDEALRAWGMRHRQLDDAEGGSTV